MDDQKQMCDCGGSCQCANHDACTCDEACQMNCDCSKGMCSCDKEVCVCHNGADKAVDEAVSDAVGPEEIVD